MARRTGRSLAANGLPPPGRFTCHDPKGYTPAEAIDLVHGVLLQYGVTLIQRSGLLLVVRLADEFHFELVPRVGLQELPQLPQTKIVWTTLPLHSLTAERAARELEPTLSARGKIVGLDLGNQIVVCDQAGAIRRLQNLLAQIDPPVAQSASLRVFVLQHIGAEEAARIVRELVGGTGEGKSASVPVDFQQMGKQLGNSSMLEAFIPGFSMGDIVPPPPRVLVTTRIAVDDRRNSLLITGEPSVLAAAEQVIRTIDVPDAEEGSSPVSLTRSYRVEPEHAEELARRINELFHDSGLKVVAAPGGFLIVSGTAQDHAQIEEILGEAQGAKLQLVVFPTGTHHPEHLARLFDSLFKLESSSEESRPTFVADTVCDSLLVRGTAEQIEQVRRLMADLSDRPGAAPLRLEVHR